jgi:hypothetical protein
MARIAKNILRIRALSGGRHLLYGYILGEKIRKRSRDYNELNVLKSLKEAQVRLRDMVLEDEPRARMTRLTQAQLSECESAILRARGRPLKDFMDIGEKYLPPLEAVSCDTALKEWLDALTARKRSERTSHKNELRVTAFLEATKAKHLPEITPEMLDAWVYRGGKADFTRLTDAQVLRAWLNYCVKRRWLGVTPFQIDMSDLSATARPKAPGRILTAKQCHSLLAVAKTHADGRFLPYCILTLWCFLRDSEARRITRANLKLDALEPVVEVNAMKRRTVKYRAVAIPQNVLPLLRKAVYGWKDDQLVPFARWPWVTIRKNAGVLSSWQPDITRHTGISYLYQRNKDIKEVCRQAGNTSDVSFRHYLTLPAEGEADKFYAVSASPTKSPASRQGRNGAETTGIPVVLGV